MEKKRSIGVTIFGVLTIILALICLPYMFNAKSAIEPFIKPYGLILYISSFPLFVLELTLGVNILRLKEWARKYLVILTAIYIVSIFIIPSLEDKNFEQKQIQAIKNTYRPGPANTGYIIYPIYTNMGELILLRIDYALPEKTIENIEFHLQRQEPDGEYKYEFKSKEDKTLDVAFVYMNGRLNDIHLDTDFRPQPENRQSDTTLTLVTANKKEILFTFSWNPDGSIKNVNVKPAIVEETVQEMWDKKNLTPQQKEQISRNMENLPVLTVRLIKIIFYTVFLLLYILTIFFFTRPKVKEQFS